MAKTPKMKSGKLAKMSEEQKLIYLEQQKLAEEEALRNKQELVSQFLKMKLEMEENMSKLNQDKLTAEWREILRKSKSVELKKEIKILSQVFEWMMDMKESSLEGVCKDLKEAEEQFMMAKRSHMHNVDRLINKEITKKTHDDADFQRQRIGQIEMQFEEQKNYLRDKFEEEKTFLLQQHENEIIKLQNIIYALEETIMEKEAEMRADFQANMDEIKNRNLEDVHTLRLKHDMMLEKLLDMFRDSLQNYRESTHERKKNFEELKAKDDRNTQQIEAQKKKISNLEKQISKFKGKLTNSFKLWVGKNEEANYEKSLLAGELLLMKKKFHTNIKNDNEELAKLLLVIKSVQDKMKATIKQGEKLLKAAERCRKLESEREKVVPVGGQEWWGEEEKQVYQRMLVDEPKEPLTRMMYQYSELENFWKRYNKVELEKTALQAEVASLSHKNHALLNVVRGKVVDLLDQSSLPSSLLATPVKAINYDDVSILE